MYGAVTLYGRPFQVRSNKFLFSYLMENSVASPSEIGVLILRPEL